MSPSEIGFLALGLAIGTTAGAALLAVVRPHAPLRPVVRVTITPNALRPRHLAAERVTRASHLAETAPGSPDEEARLDLADGLPVGPAPATRAAPPRPPDSRTRVPFPATVLPARAVGVPIVGGGQPASGPVALAGTAVAVAAAPVATADRAAATQRDAGMGRVDIESSRPSLAVRARPPVPESRPTLAAGAVGIAVAADASPGSDLPTASKPSAGSGSSAGTASSAGAASSAVDPCAGDRAAAADLCASADTARTAARAVADRLRDAQRSHADLQARVEEAGAMADPRRIAAEKERLHAQFRTSHSSTVSADDAEAAAREWLTAVSALNAAARDAAHRAQAGNEELRALTASLEQLELEANASRVTAERAEDACRAARETLAACEERQHVVPAESGVGDEEPAGTWPGGSEATFDRRPDGPVDLERLPVILRVLRGDAAAREQMVARLAADDPSAMAAWHVRLARFTDAVTARAIEDGYLELSDEDPFWRMFSGEERREIVLALSALGFRFDGMGGFADDRVPSSRDLSLAVGYAGLDRMRIRTMPGDAALALLFEGTVVRADLWLATQADDLSLTRVEAALGPRAAALGDIWDAWGRVRPAMLEES